MCTLNVYQLNPQPHYQKVTKKTANVKLLREKKKTREEKWYMSIYRERPLFFSLLIYITRGPMSFDKGKNIVIKTLNNNKTISCSMHLARIKYGTCVCINTLSLKK